MRRKRRGSDFRRKRRGWAAQRNRKLKMYVDLQRQKTALSGALLAKPCKAARR